VGVSVGSGMAVSVIVGTGEAVRVSVGVSDGSDVKVGNEIAVCVCAIQADVRARDLILDVSCVGCAATEPVKAETAEVQKPMTDKTPMTINDARRVCGVAVAFFQSQIIPLNNKP